MQNNPNVVKNSEPRPITVNGKAHGIIYCESCKSFYFINSISENKCNEICPKEARKYVVAARIDWISSSGELIQVPWQLKDEM